MKVSFNQHVGVFENLLRPKDCQNLIDIFESNNSLSRHEEFEQNKEALSLYFPEEVLKKGVSNFIKEDKLLFLQKIDPILSQKIGNFVINNAFIPYAKKYIGIDNLTNWYIRDVKIQKTLPSQGYHVWHSENYHDGDRENRHRILAYTIYLNDVEEGGETEFLHQSLRVPPKQGSVCLFPSYFTHTHRGNPPLSGEKYIVTGWIINDDLAQL